MPDLSAADLVHAIRDDVLLQDWVSDRLDLPPAPLTGAPPLAMADMLPPELPTLNMVSHSAEGTWLLHLVVGPPEGLTRGMGLNALRRAAFIREAVPQADQWDFRVALIAQTDQIAAQWPTVREFPHWINAEDLGQHLRRVMAA